MKRKSIYLFLLLLFGFVKNSQSQTIFWHETFGLGCSQGSLANGSAPTVTNGAWSVVSINFQGTQRNEWFISATETGLPAGQCGDGCVSNVGLTNKTLHIGSTIATPSLDPGAFYLQSATSNTDKRVESPVIDCSQQTNIVFSFNYLSNGVPGADFAEALYYDGLAWNTLNILAPSMGTCSPKGLWASQSFSLPVFANANPDLKIGFRWRNINAAGPGNVSIAIDEITLSGQFTSGINTIKLNEAQIKLFPNPVKDKLTLDFEKNIVTKISITNSLAQIINTINNPTSKQEIDLSNLSSGVYFLKVEDHKANKVFKIIKE